MGLEPNRGLAASLNRILRRFYQLSFDSTHSKRVTVVSFTKRVTHSYYVQLQPAKTGLYFPVIQKFQKLVDNVGNFFLNILFYLVSVFGQFRLCMQRKREGKHFDKNLQGI